MSIRKFYISIAILIILALILNYMPNKKNEFVENENYIKNPHEISGTDVLRVALPKDNNPLNPFYSDSRKISTISKLLHSSLIYRDKNNNIVMDIAKDYWYEDKGKTIAVILKDNLKFPNGKTLDANDVKKTFEVLANPDYEGKYATFVDNLEGYYPFKLENTDELTGIEVLGNNFLKFRFNIIDFSNINTLTFPIVDVSQTDYKYNNMGNLIEHEFIQGLGKYKVVSKDSKKVRLELKEEDKEIGVKSIEFTFMDDIEAINKYKSGQIDIVYEYQNSSNILEALDTRTKDYSYTINHQSSFYYFLGFNQNSKLFSIDKYRRSLRDTIDVEKAMSSHNQEDRFDLLDIPVFRNSWFNQYDVNYEKEEKLYNLLEKDKDNLKELFDGDKINIKLIALEDNKFFSDLARQLKEQIDNEYLNLEIIYVSSQNMYKALKGGIEFDLFLSQRQMDDIPNQVLQDRYPVEKEYNINTQAQNSFFYISEKIKDNKNDEDIQMMTKQWKENFYITAPYIVLSTENVINVINNRVQNIYLNEFIGIDYIDNLKKIELIEK